MRQIITQHLMSSFNSLTRKLAVVLAMAAISSVAALAQSNVNNLVLSEQEGNEFHIYIDHRALDMFGDSVIVSLNSDGDSTWNTWKDVLTNGNSPGMDVNFDGWNAYGVDSLLVDGASKLDSTLEVDGYVRMNDSLYVAMYALFQAKLSVGDSLVVTGGTDLNSTLDVSGATGVDGNFDVATNKFTVDATTGNTSVAGTLGVTGAATLSSSLDVTGATGVDGNFDVATNKFTVDATTGTRQ